MGLANRAKQRGPESLDNPRTGFQNHFTTLTDHSAVSVVQAGSTTKISSKQMSCFTENFIMYSMTMQIETPRASTTTTAVTLSS